MEKAADLYSRIGYSNRIGFGVSPSLLLVDFCYGCTDSIIRSGAVNVSEAIHHSARLLNMAREKGIPVIFTTIGYTEGYFDGGVFVKKIPSLQKMLLGTKAVEIDQRVAPQPGEPVIVKKFASAFFGTTLSTMLTFPRIDTVIFVGVSTSGCIRATCVDSMQYGFRTIIPRECVADRTPDVHEANLFDMQSKYADVVSVEEVCAYLKTI